MFSETSAAAVTCGIMKPEFSPGFGVRKAGMPDSAGSTSMAMRRSASEPISQTASAIMSAANATGSAWKLPPDSAVSSSAKISGLSETPFASVSSVSAAWRSTSSAAPITCGWQRRQYGSCTRSSPTQVRGADGAAGHQVAQRVGRLDLAAMPAQRMDARIERRVRARAASVDSAPVTSAELEQHFGLEQRGQRVGGRELRAVEQRQPFLGAERHRLQPVRHERDLGREAAVRREAFADADHRRRHVRQRREVAGGADRTLRRARPG